MSNEEKIALLEDSFELESGTLSENTALDQIETFDSLAKLTLIVVCDENFNKKLTGEQIKEFKTIKDILDFMG
ncbi:MAG: acyl carrier protein [Ignavibacteriales bacterium]|nr:MAG: acyl carrier protein [Ignavibacteriales bacterium]